MASKAADGNKLPSLPPPLDPHDKPPLDRYCDLVLKGGVVDGVIYPGVLIELARKYRFQSLAGTSVGAIAASLAAACEYARRFGSDNGFNEVLRKVPEELAKDSPTMPKSTVIRSLFQTVPKLAPLFNLVVDLLAVDFQPSRANSKAPRAEPETRRPRFWGELSRGVLTCYGNVMLRWFLSGFVVAILLIPGVPDTLLWMGKRGLNSTVHFLCADITWYYFFAAVVVGFLVSLFGLRRALIKDYSRLTGQPGFGFCSGLSTDGGRTEGLTEWLHRGIQGAAGLSLSRPLTFQDLWDAPGGPRAENPNTVYKSIDLRMMTTCVSHGRPYEMPLIDSSVRLFFKLDEWKHYFPTSILDHLEIFSEKYAAKSVDVLPGGDDGTNRKPDQYNSPHPFTAENSSDFRELPVGSLPVLVAVRLSMNFPILFQAVPLWAIDHEGGRVEEVKVSGGSQTYPKFKKAWFADGGVTANFPLHVFDKAMPGWPTFGIFIKERSRKAGQEQHPSYLPEFHTSGRSEKWHDVDEMPDQNKAFTSRLKGFFDFVLGLGYAAKDWADNANLRMPTVRGRVVTVYHQGLTNGGLNFKIKGGNICRLAYINGTKAGIELANKFAGSTPGMNQALTGNPKWLDHRWVRFNSQVTALKSHIAGFTAASNNAQGTSPLREQIKQASKIAPLFSSEAFEPTLTKTQVEALLNAAEAIEHLEAEFDKDQTIQPYIARPQYELKPRAAL